MYTVIIILLIITIFIFGAFHMEKRRKEKLRQLYSGICLKKNFVDISGDANKKLELAEKISMLKNSITLSSHSAYIEDQMLLYVLLQEKEDKKIYLLDMSPWSAKKSGGRSHPEHPESILIIEMPVNTEKKYYMTHKIPDFAMSLVKLIKVNLPPQITALEPDFKSKFTVYTLSPPEESHILTPEIQRLISCQYERYPFKRYTNRSEHNTGTIVIYDQYLYISGFSIYEEQDMEELLNLGQTLSDCIIKSLQSDTYNQLTDRGIKVCPHCGANIESHNEFCINCGQQI